MVSLSRVVSGCTFLVAAAIGFSASNVSAQVSLTFEETGGDVVGTLSGSLDVSSGNLLEPLFGGPPNGILPAGPSITMGFSSDVTTFGVDSYGTMVDLYGLDDFTPFGSGGFTAATMSTSDPFGIFVFADDIDDPVPSSATFDVSTGPFDLMPVVAVPMGYSGEELSGTITFESATFSSLGIAAGDYEFTLDSSTEILSTFQTRDVSAPSNSITVSFVSDMAAVPLPAGLPMLLAGLGGFALLRRRASARPDAI